LYLDTSCMIVQEKYDALCNIAVRFDVLGLVIDGMILLSQVFYVKYTMST